MLYCRKCSVSLKEVLSFPKRNKEKFLLCPKCRDETKYRKINDDDLDFSRILKHEMHKRREDVR